MQRGSVVCLALILLVSASALGAQDDGADSGDELEDVFGGFGDEEDGTFDYDEDDFSGDEVLRFWDLSGALDFDTSYNYRKHRSSSGTWYGGVQLARTKLALELDLDLWADWKARISGWGFYDISYLRQGRSSYTSEVRNSTERDYDLSDTYVEGSVTDDVDLKAGRQIVDWGRSESIRVLDIVNPLDNRQPGQMDIEDIRRPLTMAKVGGFLGKWSLTMLAIPEIRFDKNPVFGSDFFPNTRKLFPQNLCQSLDLPAPVPPGCDVDGTIEFTADFAQLPPDRQAGLQAFFASDDLTQLDLSEKTPADWGRGTEFMANVTGIFSGWDISFQAARYYDDRPHLNADADKQRFQHSRLWMVGTGANYVVRDWLFKAELAYIDGLQYFWVTDEKSRVDVMGGIEYYGISDVTIVVEVLNRHINDFDRLMKQSFDWAEENRSEGDVRITLDLFNSTLHLTALGFAIGILESDLDGSFVRLEAEYELMDALRIRGGLLLFQNGDNPGFVSVGRNDRIFFGATLSF